MHLNLSQPVLLVLLLAWLTKSQFSQSIITPNLELGGGVIFGQRIFYADNNFTRPKRQLFREDIPHHRPLSGNHYAMQHGFPHPGRWADGTRNPYKTTANLPPPHQAYFDALDGGRVGRYHTGFSSGVGVGSVGGSGGGGRFFGSSGGGHRGQSGGSGGHNFGNELSQGGLRGEYGLTGSGFHDDDDGGGDHHHTAAPLPLIHQEHYGPGEKEAPHYGAPPHVNVQFHGNYPNNQQQQQHKPPTPTYGGHGHSVEKPQEEQPKTFVHYHPIQYSQVLNIPESPAPHPHPQPQPAFYGPPNHVSGPLIEEGGFIPSKGITYENDKHHHHNHHVPKKPIVHLHHHHHHTPQESDGPYRFDPFKLFSQIPNKHVSEAEGPVKIPILAQFHTSKPIKFTKLKEPIHIIYRHPPSGGQHYGPPPPHPHSRRPQFNFHNRRPKMPHNGPPDWFFSSGLH